MTDIAGPASEQEFLFDFGDSRIEIPVDRELNRRSRQGGNISQVGHNQMSRAAKNNKKNRPRHDTKKWGGIQEEIFP